MKPFETYQCLEEPVTARDHEERGSKFWNQGKWCNYVAPFLPAKCAGLTFIDVGCNAGLYLALASRRGFSQVIGIDSNEGAVTRGTAWRDKNKQTYDIRLADMQYCLPELPVADYTLLSNVHYYFTIDNWVRYIDALRFKTTHCIVVTTERRPHNRCWPLSDVDSVRRYFAGWHEVGFVDALPLEGPHARKLWGLCFKSPLKRVLLDDLDCGNHVQDRLYAELDKGTHPHSTRYYRILKRYRKNWTPDQLNEWVLDKVELYDHIKLHGMLEPLLVDQHNRVLDGNHRYSMLKHLGHKTVIVRYV